MSAEQALSVRDQILVAAVRLYMQSHSPAAGRWIGEQCGLPDPLMVAGLDPSHGSIMEWQHHPDGMHMVLRMPAEFRALVN